MSGAAAAGAARCGRAQGDPRSARANALQPYRCGQAAGHHVPRAALPDGAARASRTNSIPKAERRACAQPLRMNSSPRCRKNCASIRRAGQRRTVHSFAQLRRAARGLRDRSRSSSTTSACRRANSAVPASSSSSPTASIRRRTRSTLDRGRESVRSLPDPARRRADPVRAVREARVARRRIELEGRDALQRFLDRNRNGRHGRGAVHGGRSTDGSPPLRARCRRATRSATSPAIPTWRRGERPIPGPHFDWARYRALLKNKAEPQRARRTPRKSRNRTARNAKAAKKTKTRLRTAKAPRRHRKSQRT